MLNLLNALKSSAHDVWLYCIYRVMIVSINGRLIIMQIQEWKIKFINLLTSMPLWVWFDGAFCVGWAFVSVWNWRHKKNVHWQFKWASREKMNKMTYTLMPINYCMRCKWRECSWKSDVEMDIYVVVVFFSHKHQSHWLQFKRFIMCKRGMQTNQPDE